MLEHVPPLLPVLAVTAVSPWLSSHTGSLRVPGAVFEIVLGALIGPQVLGLVAHDHGLPYLATMGMAFLFFLAGMEIDLGEMKGTALRLASVGWVLSLLLGLGAAFLLAQVGGSPAWDLVGVALSTTALGIVVPILRDAELSNSLLGRYTVAAGALGELGPIILMSLLLTTERGVGAQLGLVIAFLLLLVGVFWASLVVRPPGLLKLLARTMTQSGQLPIRFSVLLLVSLVVLAELFGLDLALGAFAAGMTVGLALKGTHTEVLHHKFDAIGFGFFVPIFFVCSGIQLDIRALFGSAAGVLMMLVYAVLLLVARGLPAILFRRELEARHVAAVGLYSATSLSLIVAITGAAVKNDLLSKATGAQLVGGGLLSVLIFPIIATKLGRQPEAPAVATPGAVSKGYED